MNKYYLFLDNQKIIAFSKNKISSKKYETIEIETENFLTSDNIQSYTYENGVLVFNKEKYNNNLKNKLLLSLRKQREEECFSIVNRGQLWYNQLTEEQLQELREWYEAWLNVTETLTKPEKPQWLK